MNHDHERSIIFKGTIAPEKYKTEVNIEVIPVTCTLEL